MFPHRKKSMDQNPYNICTHNPESDCKDCINYNILHCKHDARRQTNALIVVFTALVITLGGTILTGLFTGIWWMAVAYGAFLILFFLVIEPRFTCSHCPYYAEKTKILNCTANIISPKLWKYHPEPMNTYEKIGSTSGFIFFAVFPLATELYGLLFLIETLTNTTFLPLLSLCVITLASLGSIILFFITFLVYFCPYCINFSCPFNKAPKNLVQEYIEKNPVIKEAMNRTENQKP
jgi:hypothetical protein